jgi:selenide,water dikinase
MSEEQIRLTQFSHGAGCGCKIAPKVLEQILQSGFPGMNYKNLLVGNESRDDAAVIDLGNGNALISTTDFFMPIVDDPFDFGRIAAANAISDVYAMGGSPMLALAILGFPVGKLDVGIAQKIIEGGRAACSEANIPLAGGHSIDSPEPIFGLAVTGMVPVNRLKKNNTGREGDLLFLTKPLGVGILSTAQKRGLLKPEHQDAMIGQLTTLNKAGEKFSELESVHAMTDVTGFGLLGHLVELAEGSGLSAELEYSRIPVAEGVRGYIEQRIFPDATSRNWSSYSEKIKFEKGVNVMEAFTLLPDPQTNGGLLVSISKEGEQDFKNVLKEIGLTNFSEPIGKLIARDEKIIRVLP